MPLSKIEESSLNLLANSENVKKALNANNGAPIYACRAWVNFNGTGTVAIRASGNVSSITDNGTGDYTVNFTTAMPDINYSAAFSVGTGSVGDTPVVESTATGSVRMQNGNWIIAAMRDPSVVNVSIFR